MRRVFAVHVVLGLAALAWAQEAQQWTERRNLGFEGPVRSVLTSVVRPNPDPHPAGQRKLFYQTSPEWVLFDEKGTRIEISTGATADKILQISRRTLNPDGTEVWTDSGGHTSQSRRQERQLADGSREVTYYEDSKITNREVTRFDDQGRIVFFGNYNGDGQITSEESSVFDETGETKTSKVYDHGLLAMENRTRAPADNTRLDRWEYGPDGGLVWHIAINDHGELLSYWYKSGYAPKMTSSDSLGICRPQLCVSYLFDEEGHLGKTIQHTRGTGTLDPESEEHYGATGQLDEKIEFKYTRDAHGNWTSRSVFVWDAATNQMIEVERNTRKIEYY